ncbi:MAG: hypothetical protein JW871_06955 [Endomicrobiales bacterium]|nr:hypothetical protein [Endomicrobiales bacterium]
MAEDEPIRINFYAKTRTNALLRSAVLPGWGQVFNGQRRKGYIIGAMELTTVLGSVYLFSQASTKYDEYADTGLKNSTLYDDYQTQYNTAVMATGVAVVIWLYSMADAYFSGSSADMDYEEEIRDWKVYMYARKDLKVLYQYKF